VSITVSGLSSCEAPLPQQCLSPLLPSKLGRSSAHRRALLRNLVTQVIKHGRIRTTLAKAKELRRMADKAVTLAKRGTLASRRNAEGLIFERAVIRKLFHEMPGRMADRTSGYTRIVRLGRRKGDNAEMCYVGYVDVLPSRHEFERRAREESQSQAGFVPPEGKEAALEDLFLLGSSSPSPSPPNTLQ